TEPAPSTALVNAQLHAARFTLAHLWQAFDIHGPALQLNGEGRFDASLSTPMSRFTPTMHGSVQLTNLTWHERFLLGALEGDLDATPERWQLEHFRGELFGGSAEGSITGSPPMQKERQMAFDMKVDRMSLAQACDLLPALSHHISGFGTMRLAGTFEEGLHSN